MPIRSLLIPTLLALLLSAPLQAGITYTVGVESLVGRTSSNGTLDPLTVRVGKFGTGFTPNASNYDQWLTHFTLLMPAQDLVTDGTAFITASSPDTGPWRMASNSLTVNQGADPSGFASGDVIYVWISNATSSGSSTEAALLTDSTWTYTMATAGPQTPVTFRLQDEAPTVIVGSFNHHFTDSASETGIRLVTQNINTITPNAGVIAIDTATYSANENVGTINATLTRTGGSFGTVTVTANTTNGTATAGTDYEAVSGSVITFNDGQTTKTIPLTILSDSTAEANETFTLTISAATGGATLGTRINTTITIVELGDLTFPTVALFSPVANATVPEGSGTTVVSGSASDDRGISKIQVRLNEGNWSDATATISTNQRTATYLMEVTPIGGPNTVSVRSMDTSGNFSGILTRSFNYIKQRPLTVIVNGPPGSGTVTKPFAGNTALRPVGTKQLITAVAKPGFYFIGWSANSWVGTGVSPLRSKTARLEFTMQDNLILTANFAIAPFDATLSGVYSGLVRWMPEFDTGDGIVYTDPSHSTAGAINATLTGRGTLTGSIRIEGQTVPLVGTVDDEGVVWFGKAGAVQDRFLFLTNLSRPGTFLELRVDMDASPLAQIDGSVWRLGRSGNIEAMSSVWAVKAAFGAGNPLPSSYVNKKSQAYTSAMTARMVQPSGIPTGAYPLGAGFGTGTVTSAGAVTFSGILGDGTKWSAAAPVVDIPGEGLFWPMYQSIYGNKGSIVGWIQLNEDDSNYDMSGGLHWFRPFQLVQWYPFGWDDGLVVDFSGSKYNQPPVSPRTSVFPGSSSSFIGNTHPLLGNAVLGITDGLLAQSIQMPLNINPVNAVNLVPSTDRSVSLKIIPSTGLITGSFLHSDGTRPALNGVILQRGPSKGAYGHFRSAAPKALTYDGEGGGFSIRAR